VEKQRNDDLVRHVAAAISYQRAGQLQEAEGAYIEALKIAPAHAAVLHNLALLFIARDDFAAAVNHLDASIAAEPRYASAHYNRAVAMEALGSVDEAISGYIKTVALEPDHYASHRALGFLFLGKGDRGRSLDHFTRTYELRRGDDRSGIASLSLQTASRSKLLHDAEQFRYLARRTRHAGRFDVLARNYEAVGNRSPASVFDLAEVDFEMLGDDYNTAIHLSGAPELPGRTVRHRVDVEEVCGLFRLAGAVQIDDLLTEAALASLTRYLLESTIWHDFSHIGGFVASYLEDGLACPLLLQIADEVRAAFPDILNENPFRRPGHSKGLPRVRRLMFMPTTRPSV
jgi:tetratricopeptide (TPR) repeat protein